MQIIVGFHMLGEFVELVQIFLEVVGGSCAGALQGRRTSRKTFMCSWRLLGPLSEVDGATARVPYQAVSKERRGQGLGNVLAHSVEDAARKHGCGRVSLVPYHVWEVCILLFCFLISRFSMACFFTHLQAAKIRQMPGAGMLRIDLIRGLRRDCASLKRLPDHEKAAGYARVAFFDRLSVCACGCA